MLWLLDRSARRQSTQLIQLPISRFPCQPREDPGIPVHNKPRPSLRREADLPRWAKTERGGFIHSAVFKEKEREFARAYRTWWNLLFRPRGSPDLLSAGIWKPTIDKGKILKNRVRCSKGGQRKAERDTRAVGGTGNSTGLVNFWNNPRPNLLTEKNWLLCSTNRSQLG